MPVYPIATWLSKHQRNLAPTRVGFGTKSFRKECCGVNSTAFSLQISMGRLFHRIQIVPLRLADRYRLVENQCQRLDKAALLQYLDAAARSSGMMVPSACSELRVSALVRRVKSFLINCRFRQRVLYTLGAYDRTFFVSSASSRIDGAVLCVCAMGGDAMTALGSGCGGGLDSHAAVRPDRRLGL